MMYKGDFNDGVWNEYQWEDYLNEIERNNNHFRQFIAPDSPDDIPRWLILLNENSDELDAVDAFIEEELQIEDIYFSEDYDDLDEDWDEDLDEFAEDEYLFDEEDDFDLGEEWKELSDDYATSDYGSIEMFNISNDARELAAVILQWAETINPKYLTKHCNDFVGNILKISAKIAGGYSFGFELDFMGGNIAYTKKALYSANDALTILQRNLKGTDVISNEQYSYFHQQLFELRNDIGIYVQELRDQFNRGIE